MEYKSLLSTPDDLATIAEVPDEECAVRPKTAWRRWPASTTTLSVTILIEAVAILGLLLYIQSTSRTCPEDIGYYPAREAVHYYETTFAPGEVFMSKDGFPTKETDKPGAIFNFDRLRKSYHRGHYFANETEHGFVHHREHCIEHLRQSIMCSGDIAMDRWQRDPEDQESWLLTTGVPHVCRSFDSLSDWVKKHQLHKRDWTRVPKEGQGEVDSQ
ncbi:hypothetical protein M409DRAFT_26715 [Zasmidium cellare ATCC 36951]|uniref:Uncharacterized protein n=1 Tax=Zasmidium cellare ATCC 36951 TaxID=1080233 RepID=A0A6A6C9C7_ZASCE|nr:uncharacterized protein M409DRAFT_26715 [Zasmidium cellare ATCC 36951]KAF2162860.1 hypothetical protein M409DRAFT_26715 [Zasmidium cellare ATCC 36951]